MQTHTNYKTRKYFGPLSWKKVKQKYSWFWEAGTLLCHLILCSLFDRYSLWTECTLSCVLVTFMSLGHDT